MATTFENVIHSQNHIGESPLWHPLEQALYWVDIRDHPAIYRWQPGSRRLEIFPIAVALSAIGWRQTGGLIAASRYGITSWTSVTGLTFLRNLEFTSPDTRLNDGAVDSQGRFWVGSMNVNDHSSNMYRFDPGYQLHQMDSGFIVSNGIGWSLDNQTMYFTDSFQHTIFAYDFSPISGAISNRRVFIDTQNEPGVPDGLVVDNQGGIWSVFCRGWKVVRYYPDGTKDLEIQLPVECPTSCTFGGENLDTLYITSSRGLIRETEPQAQPLAGSLFCYQTGFQGKYEPAFTG